MTTAPAGGNHTATETAGCVNRTAGGVEAREDNPPRIPDKDQPVLRGLAFEGTRPFGLVFCP